MENIFIKLNIKSTKDRTDDIIYLFLKHLV